MAYFRYHFNLWKGKKSLYVFLEEMHQIFVIFSVYKFNIVCFCHRGLFVSFTGACLFHLQGLACLFHLQGLVCFIYRGLFVSFTGACLFHLKGLDLK